jgi:hypothetical protein
MPARSILVVCSGSHEKKVNLGEVFRHEKKVNLGEVFRISVLISA